MVFLDQLVLALVVPVAIILLAKRQTQTEADSPQHNPDNRKKYYDY
jgi:hypothetical protein